MEMGRFFEDFTVGDIYRSRLGRTITETDNIQFTMITNNTNQIHFNAHYASRTEFKKPLVNSALTLSVIAGLGVSDLSENGFALGWDYIIRSANNTYITFSDGRQIAVDQLGVKPGQRRYFPNVRLTREADWCCNIAITWTRATERR